MSHYQMGARRFAMRAACRTCLLLLLGLVCSNALNAQVNSTPVNTVAPAINGTATVGNALNGSIGSWTDADGDVLTLSRQWYRADDAGGTNRMAIASATGATYTLTTSDAHKYIQLVVAANDGNGGIQTANSTYTKVANTAPVNSTLPNISGTATVGNALSTTSGTWSDADGDGRAYTYQWYRADDNSGTNLTAINGATNTSYTLTGSDAQKYLRVVVTANDGNGGITPASSGYTSAINTLPSDIALSSSSVNQSAGINAIVGTLSSADSDIGNTFTYTLVAGSGSTDNALFNISGNSLRVNDASALAAGSYSVRIRTTDNNGGAFEKTFSITLVDDIAPTVTISSNKASLKAGETATITFTMSESVIGFAFNDVGVEHGTISTISGSGASYSTTFTPAADTEANATINIEAGGFWDAAGNANTAATPLNIAVDTRAPNAPSTPVLSALSDSGVADDNITNTTTPVFTGTAEAGSTVTLYKGTTVLGMAIATGGIWSITSGALGEGSHSITAKATDSAGNESNASVARVVTIDTTPHAKPSAPVLAAASDTGDSNADRVTNLTTLTLQGAAGSVEANASVHARSDLQGGLTNTTANADGSWTLVVSDLTESTHQFTIYATDIAGNQSVNSDPLTVTIDTTPPASGTVTFDQSKITAANERAISFSLINAEVGAKASFSITSSNGGTPVTTTDMPVASPNHKAIGIDTRDLNDGTLTLSLTVTDLAGNVSTVVTDTITKDATAPEVSSVDIDSGNYREGNKISVTITFSEIVTLSGTNSTIALDIGREIRQAAYRSKTAKALTYEYIVQATDNTDSAGVIVLADGLSLNGGAIRDAAGNDALLTFAQTANAAAQVDTIAPNSAIVISPTAPVSVNADDYTISGTHVENGLIVKLYLDADNNGVPDNGLILDSAVVSNGTWSLIAPLVGDSANNFVVVAEDAAGNASVAYVPTITEDSIAPNAPVALDLLAVSDTGVSNSDNITRNTEPQLVGTAEPHSTITLTSNLDGITGTAVADSLGGWTITSNVLTNGVHTLTATATDAAGNTSEQSMGLTVTIDDQAPSLSAIADQRLNPSASSGDLAITISDEITEAANLMLVAESSDHDVVPAENLAIGGSGASRTITVTALDSGTATITLSVEDEAGNTATRSFMVLVNSGPTISGSPATQVDRGAAYRFVPTASDADGDTLSFSAQGLPAWLSVNAATGEVSGTAPLEAIGESYAIELTVSDGTESASLSWDLAVVLQIGDITALWLKDGELANERFGGSLALFDATGDGLAEVYVGSPTRTVDVAGKKLKNAGGVDILAASNGALLHRVNASVAKQRFGSALAVVADQNNDGVEDLIVGKPFAGKGGEIALHSGDDGSLIRTLVKGEGKTASPIVSMMPLCAIDPQHIVCRILGSSEQGGRIGYSVTVADVDGSGGADLVVGLPQANVKTPVKLNKAGSVIVYQGLTDTPRYVLNGTQAGERFGSSVAADGDYIFVGSPNFDVQAAKKLKDAGRVQLFNLQDGSVAGAAEGTAAKQLLGSAVASFNQDVNADGQPDWAVAGAGDKSGKPVKLLSGISAPAQFAEIAVSAPNKVDAIRLASGMDINGDGISDLVIGLPNSKIQVPFNNKSKTLKNAGQVQVVSGANWLP